MWKLNQSPFPGRSRTRRNDAPAAVTPVPPEEPEPSIDPDDSDPASVVKERSRDAT